MYQYDQNTFNKYFSICLLKLAHWATGMVTHLVCLFVGIGFKFHNLNINNFKCYSVSDKNKIYRKNKV